MSDKSDSTRLNMTASCESMPSNPGIETQDTVKDRAQIRTKRHREVETRKGSPTDILERIAHAQITRQKQAAAGNPPPSKRIKLEEDSVVGILANPIIINESPTPNETRSEVDYFFAAHNYVNQTIMDALEDSGFTKFELLTMQGLDKKTLIDRFQTILPSGFCRQAQIESLSYVVCSASEDTWNNLKSDNLA